MYKNNVQGKKKNNVQELLTSYTQKHLEGEKIQEKRSKEILIKRWTAGGAL